MMIYDINKLNISSSHPCLIVYLVDQSYSMNERFGGPWRKRADAVAESINDTIYNLGLSCLSDNGLKNRFEVAVIGYGAEKDVVQSAWIGNLQRSWVCTIEDIFNNPVDTKNDKPVWILPKAGHNTPMNRAFENAHRLCYDWINFGNHLECHPPIIINITDGEATDSGTKFTRLKETVHHVKNLRTHYDAVKVFNVHISSDRGGKVAFPMSEPTHNAAFASLLYDLSSELNTSMIERANALGYNISQGARGYIFNGDSSDLINFLKIGSDPI